MVRPEYFQQVLQDMSVDDQRADWIWRNTPDLARANVLATRRETRSEGIALLMSYLEKYPNSSNVCALVAQALAADGRQDEAIAFVRSRFPRYFPNE